MAKGKLKLTGPQLDVLYRIATTSARGRYHAATIRGLGARNLIYYDRLGDLHLTTEGQEIVREERRRRRAARKKPFQFFKLRDAEHTARKPPGVENTIGELRRFFMAYLGSVSKTDPTQAPEAVRLMREIHRTIPDEFHDGAEEELDRLFAEAVARRLLS